MELFIDADACPVTNLTVNACKAFGVSCWILCDTAHEIYRDGAKTLVFDKGADSVDFALANRVKTGDIVITQDYGLAAMCLAKGAVVLHQDGWRYTSDNIQSLLFTRHEARKYRNAGGRTKGPAKRTKAQDEAFLQALNDLFQNRSQG